MAALADGIFSVAMTLLVIDIRLPEGMRVTTSADLARYLASAASTFVAYFVSFLVLAMIWVGHNYQFRYVERLDRRLLWVNLAFLLLVTLVPFTTNVIAWHANLSLAASLYAINLGLLNIALYVHLRCMAASPDTHTVELTPTLARHIERRLLLICGIPVLALVVAQFSPWWSVHVFYLLAVLHFVPHRHAEPD